MTRQRVIFAFRPADRGMGSRIMRCDQLCEMANRHLGRDYDFTVAQLPPSGAPRRLRQFARRAEGAVVIGLKHAFADIEPELFDRLRRRFAGLAIDHVDSVPGDAMMRVADLHLVASHEGVARVRARLAGLGAGAAHVCHLTHHADPRLPGPVAQDAFAEARIVYLGNPRNTVLPDRPEMAAGITCLDHLSLGFEAAIAGLSGYNVHYAIRRSTRNAQASKPFTKGFVAAAMDAVLLVDAGTDDARHYLGADYPFLVPSNAQGDIHEGLRHLRASFGTAEWQRARERMAYLRHVSSAHHITAELRQALRLLA